MPPPSARLLDVTVLEIRFEFKPGRFQTYAGDDEADLASVLRIASRLGADEGPSTEMVIFHTLSIAEPFPADLSVEFGTIYEFDGELSQYAASARLSELAAMAYPHLRSFAAQILVGTPVGGARLPLELPGIAGEPAV